MGKGHLWAEPTPLKNDGVRKCWDDDIPNMMGKIKFMFQTTNQLSYLVISFKGFPKWGILYSSSSHRTQQVPAVLHTSSILN